MAKSRLITPSLVGAISWLNVSPESWKARALNDLRNQLSRTYSDEMPDAIKRGIEFENAVYACARAGKTDIGTANFQWFVKQCVGAEFQRKAKAMRMWGGEEYCLYGKLDAFKPGLIIDLKTTGEWKGAHKYLSTFQHKMYCYIKHVAEFHYLVAVMASVEGKPYITETHLVEYWVEDWGALEKEVEETVMDTMAFLSARPELFELYRTKFCLY